MYHTNLYYPGCVDGWFCDHSLAAESSVHWKHWCMHSDWKLYQLGKIPEPDKTLFSNHFIEHLPKGTLWIGALRLLELSLPKTFTRSIPRLHCSWTQYWVSQLGYSPAPLWNLSNVHTNMGHHPWRTSWTWAMSCRSSSLVSNFSQADDLVPRLVTGRLFALLLHRLGYQYHRKFWKWNQNFAICYETPLQWHSLWF